MVADDAARERLARDPATPLATLQQLARDRGLRPAIAENPSTYPDLLAWLGGLGEPETDAALARRAGGGSAGEPPTAVQPRIGQPPTEQLTAEPPTEQLTAEPPISDERVAAAEEAPAAGPGGAAIPVEEPTEQLARDEEIPAHVHTEEVGPGGAAVPLSDDEQPAHEPSYDPEATAVYTDPDLVGPATDDRPPTFTPTTPVERPPSAVPTDAPTEVFRAVRDAGPAGAAAVDPAGTGTRAEHGGGPVPWGTGPSGEAAAGAAAAAAAESTAHPPWRPPHAGGDTQSGRAPARHHRPETPPERPGTPAGGVPAGGAGRGALVMAAVVIGALFVGAALWFLLARNEPVDDEGGGVPPLSPSATSRETTSAPTQQTDGDVDAARSAVVALASGSSCDDPAADAGTIEEFADAGAPSGMWENPGDAEVVMTALRGLQDTCGAPHAVAVEQVLLDSGSTALVTTLTSADAWVQLARPAPPGAQERPSFTSPSGNIACSLAEDSATCTIAEHSFTGPDECVTAGTVAATVALDGETQVTCAQAPVAANGALQYGQAATSGYLACTSAREGVTCWSTLSGHGFSLARAALDRF